MVANELLYKYQIEELAKTQDFIFIVLVDDLNTIYKHPIKNIRFGGCNGKKIHYYNKYFSEESIVKNFPTIDYAKNYLFQQREYKIGDLETCLEVVKEELSQLKDNFPGKNINVIRVDVSNN